MDSGKIIMNLGALLYYDKPQQKEGKPVQFEDLPKEDQSLYLKKSAKVLHFLSKMECEVVPLGTSKKSELNDQQVEDTMFKLLKSNVSKLTHPKNLLDFLNDDVLKNIAHNLCEGQE